MHLGIVMTGAGALAAANVGVLRLLEARGIEIYAVCGLHGGAWPAAQFVCGQDAADMEDAIAALSRAGNRLLQSRYSSRAILTGERAWMSDGTQIERFLKLQTGERLLALCGRRGIFPCRLASSGRRVVFSTSAYAQGRDVQLTQQATVSFAARAAMARPPFLSPMSLGGSWLLAEEDAAWAAGQLERMGADRVLMIQPRPSPARAMDALELAAAQSCWPGSAQMQDASVLRVTMPASIGALDFRKAPEIVRIGYETAQLQLDQVLDELGMAHCRILPFKMRAQAAISPRSARSPSPF